MMFTDMSNYKMVYQDQVFNVVGVIPTVYAESSGATPKIQFIEATYIDENGELRIVKDEAWTFKFVRR